MGTSSAFLTIAGGVWQGAIALAATLDAIYTGLPVAVLAVLWLAALAGPIVPTRRRWSAARRLGTLLAAGAAGLLVGVILHLIAATPRLSAECLSFGAITMLFSIVASLPAALRLVGEDSALAATAR